MASLNDDGVKTQGTASGTHDDAGADIDRLSKEYTGSDTFQGHAPGDVRVKYVITSTRVRHQTQ